MMTNLDNRDNFKDFKFGNIDFAFSPVFKSFILHKPAEKKLWSVQSLKDLCIHKITCYSEVSSHNTTVSLPSILPGVKYSS